MNIAMVRLNSEIEVLFSIINVLEGHLKPVIDTARPVPATQEMGELEGSELTKEIFKARHDIRNAGLLLNNIITCLDIPGDDYDVVDKDKDNEDMEI